jgi:hypothetical protein
VNDFADVLARSLSRDRDVRQAHSPRDEFLVAREMRERVVSTVVSEIRPTLPGAAVAHGMS